MSLSGLRSTNKANTFVHTNQAMKEKLIRSQK